MNRRRSRKRRRKVSLRRRQLSRSLVKATYKRNLTRLACRAETRQERVDACNAINAHHSTKDISTTTKNRLLKLVNRQKRKWEYHITPATRQRLARLRRNIRRRKLV